MLLEGKLKKVALLVAVDIYLKKVNYSPKRCARNMIELGINAYPEKITESEKSNLYNQLLTFFENGDIPGARALFSSTFL